MTANDQYDSLIQGLFNRPPGGEEMEVLRPPGMYFPIGVTVRWVTPGQGRETLNEMLGTILVLEMDHLAKAAVAGESYRIDPLKELGDREGWELETSLKQNPQTYSLIKDGTEKEHLGPRLDLLLALELMMRCALKPFQDQAKIPGWVNRSRQVYTQVLKALDEQPLFQQKNGPV